MRRQADAWLDSAGDDLRVAAAILGREDLTHMVAFHCQQAIEKALKAALAEHSATVPRVHDLVTLRQLAHPHVQLEGDLDLLDEISELYTDARYPTDLGVLPGGKPPVALAEAMYGLARHIVDQVTSSLL